MTGMKMGSTLVLAGTVLAAVAVEGRAGWGIGIGIGAPVYYRPWGPYYYPYYAYRPVYVAPSPVVVESPPVIVPSAPAVQPVYQASPSPVPSPIMRTGGQDAPQPEMNHLIQQLRDPDERVRADSVLQLGRQRALASVDPLAATLAGDRSPMVREAAARALGLISSPKALPALQRAAAADPDRDVRHSAQFAIDIVQSRP
jgi:HEAT repeats